MSGFVGGRGEARMSWIRLSKSILVRHLYWMVLQMGSGLANLRVNRMALWSDIFGFEILRSETMWSSVWVMTRSGVCPWWWVGSDTCCLRLQESRSDKKRLAGELAVSLTWKLKSPTIRILSGQIISCSKSELNSLKKVSSDDWFFDDDGGGRLWSS